MPVFRIKSFWKDQLHNSATKLPADNLDAETFLDAVYQYINKHYPFLKLEDAELVASSSFKKG